jgi:hypothetical protein
MSPNGTCTKKTPSKLRANPRKTAVIRRFTQGFEASLLIPAAPKMMAKDMPSATKVNIMPRPYRAAIFNAPARVRDEWFAKKETVIGTIGNTQGVSSDSAPMPSESQK